MPSGDSLSAPPEDLRPRTKHTRFGGVDVRPYRFTAPGYSEPRTSGHYWCSPLSSYVMSSITQFVPTRLVVGDIAEATLVATSTALGLLASTTGRGGSTASPHLPGRGGGRGDGAVAVLAKTSMFTTLIGCVNTDSLRALLMLVSGSVSLVRRTSSFFSHIPMITCVLVLEMHRRKN